MERNVNFYGVWLILSVHYTEIFNNGNVSKLKLIECLLKFDDFKLPIQLNDLKLNFIIIQSQAQK